jgi:hypothetical protein
MQILKYTGRDTGIYEADNWFFIGLLFWSNLEFVVLKAGRLPCRN